MNPVIVFDHVSKKFKMHHQRARSFQEMLVSLTRRSGNTETKNLWVLRDINFEIHAGETVAFIGPNGTGKSTSLKLISGILFPNAGTIEVNGRVGALLELGAGFHSDLTGRENIYLNGAIFGLSRRDIQQKMDAIVAFSELEQFIDIPVKHYSSGMYMRLGFSIAVYTDPEILLVDEVLAVGDANFQRKCLEHIDHLCQQGVTILLVSHNLDAVRKVCRRAIWMEQGRILADGPTDTVVQQYLLQTYNTETNNKSKLPDRRWGSGEVQIRQVRTLNQHGRESNVFCPGDTMIIEIQYQTTMQVNHPVFGLAIHRSDGTHVTGPNTKFTGYDIPAINGRGAVKYIIRHLPLLEGTFYISVAAHNWDDTKMYDYHDRLYTFNVMPAGEERFGLMTLGGEWVWENQHDIEIF